MRPGSRLDLSASAQGTEQVRSVVCGVTRITWIGLVINLLLSVVKAVAGILGNSRALVADAIHSLSDLATDAAVLIGVRYWSAPADEEHPHGHQKIEQLVALVIGALLFLVGAFLAYDAVKALAFGHEGRAIPKLFAFFVALLSVLVKEGLYRWTLREGIRLKSPAVIANAWHHRSDALSSIPAGLSVLGAEVGARFGFDLAVLDPLGTAIVACMIMHASWRIGQEAFGSLVDAGAAPTLISQIKRLTLAVNGVRSMHKVRTRRLSIDAVAVDLHIQVDPDLTICQGHNIAGAVKQALINGADGVVDVMIHVEPVENHEDIPPSEATLMAPSSRKK